MKPKTIYFRTNYENALIVFDILTKMELKSFGCREYADIFYIFKIDTYNKPFSFIGGLISNVFDYVDTIGFDYNDKEKHIITEQLPILEEI